MRLFAALLAVEVNCWIAGVLWWGRRTILALKALVTRPGFDQRPIHTEVLVREQLRAPGLSQHVVEELLGDVAFQQPIAILGEDRRHPHGFVHVEANEPPK